MSPTVEIERSDGERRFLLTELIGMPVFNKQKKVGKLADLVMVEQANTPVVTHFVIGRTFGYPSLLIPWDAVRSMGRRQIVIEISDVASHEANPADDAVLLKDHLLDKKVLDLDGNEVEVVYDIGLVPLHGKLYVTDVDCSPQGLLRRLGLARLADLLAKLFVFVTFRSDHSPRSKNVGLPSLRRDTYVRGKRISWKFIQPLPTQLSNFKGHVSLSVLKEHVAEIPPVDLADILEELDHDQRVMVFDELDTSHASDTLEEIDPNVQRALVSSLSKKRAAELINEMTPAQAADILGILPVADAATILNLLDEENATKVRSILQEQEERILDYSTTDIIKLPPHRTVGEVQSAYPELAKQKDVVRYIYVVDEHEGLLGVLDVNDLLQAAPDNELEEIMVSNIVHLEEDSTLKDASAVFERYGFRAIPILNDDNGLLGVVLYRDVMKLKHRFV